MNARIYPTVLNEVVKSTDLTFGQHFVDKLHGILTNDVVKELSEERYNVLMESMVDNNDDPSNYTSATQRFLYPDERIKKSFETLILCYASLGIIPLTQLKLGKIIEQFINISGGWVTRTTKYMDAMKFRLPGSFENGKNN